LQHRQAARLNADSHLQGLARTRTQADLKRADSDKQVREQIDTRAQVQGQVPELVLLVQQAVEQGLQQPTRARFDIISGMLNGECWKGKFDIVSDMFSKGECKLQGADVASRLLPPLM